ncbi:MAG TPA: 3'-5' exonuclease [Anaerolineales bacterium]|nr:3'-5' exonuclease [Anaerolineales bacterium]
MNLSPARLEAVAEARRWVQAAPVYLDTETTGTGPNAEIIEIGVIDADGKPLFESFVKPRGRIEPDAAQVHGITAEQVAAAPGWLDVWPQVRAVLDGRRVGVYNVDFDLRLMKQSHTRSWLRWDLDDGAFFCIMKLYARFHGEWDSKRGSYRWISLDTAGKQCGISLPNAHRAIDDALLTRALLHHMAGLSF